MIEPDLIGPLRRLCEGLADREIRSGTRFLYDGSPLHADEVSDLLLPSLLCTSLDLPIVMQPTSQPKLFLEIAPFVVEVFDGKLMDCRADLLRLFEAAAQVIRPDFSLERDTRFSKTPALG
jgi:hypothetical protein